MRSLALGACLFVLAAVPAAADDAHTNADLFGGYSFSIAANRGQGAEHDIRYVGVLVADGSGNITSGSRTVFRYDVGQNEPTLRWAAQSATGTYDIRPDGTGTISVTWTPALPPETSNESLGSCSAVQWLPTETLHVALAEGGFNLVQQASAQLVIDCPPPSNGSNGIRPLVPTTTIGWATRQGPPCEGGASATSVNTRRAR